MTIANLQWAEASIAVDSAQHILVVTHVFPDGDAIGSLLGLANILSERGKQVVTAVDGGVPKSLSYLPGAEKVLPVLDAGEWDLMISVDASDEKRTGLAGEYGRAHSRRVVNLDHHETNIFFGNLFLVDTHASSACEVVYEWVEHMDWTISLDVAVALLTGLVTDTLGFRTSSVTPRTMQIAQRLMQAGASLADIASRTLDSRPYRVIQLWQQALPTVTLDDGIISAVVTRGNLERAGMQESTDGGLIAVLITVEEAMIAAVFKETLEGEVEISLRAKPGFDVAEVAFSLEGGGHRQAAGATVPGPLDGVVSRVIPLLRDAASQGRLLPRS